jgi:hypothetical protein
MKNLTANQIEIGKDVIVKIGNKFRLVEITRIIDGTAFGGLIEFSPNEGKTVEKNGKLYTFIVFNQWHVFENKSNQLALSY